MGAVSGLGTSRCEGPELRKLAVFIEEAGASEGRRRAGAGVSEPRQAWGMR